MTDFVEDAELLYRWVEDDPKCYKIESDSLIVTSSAFFDRNKQPSVDRAKRCENNPKFTQSDNTNASVVSLISRDVRKIGLRKEGAKPVEYMVDVISDPVGSDHPTLSPIRPTPKFARILP